MQLRLLLTAFTLLSLQFAQAQCYVLAFEDNFDGTSLDLDKWHYEEGNGYPDFWGWGNGEDQYYTNRTDNLEISGGTMKMHARQETFGGFTHTAAKLRSKGTFDFRYGRIEARMRIPDGGGLWPAFWMMPTDNVYGGWPKSGEIDIMENFGQNTTHFSTIHFENGVGAHEWNSSFHGITHNNWHTFSAVWVPDTIHFFVDWTWIGAVNPSSVNGGTWPFNEKFFMILNLAVGGSADPVTSSFPKTFEVDYVRVFQLTPDIDIRGSDYVEKNSTGNKFSVPSNPTATYSWTVPGGATIESGQGTNEISVTWGNANGTVTCSVTNYEGDVAGSTQSCGNQTHNLAVTAFDGNCNYIIQDYDKFDDLVLAESDGTAGILTQNFNNPGANIVNSSPLCGRYGRLGSETWDAMKVEYNGVPLNLEPIKWSGQKLIMDVYTTATVGAGATITVQLIDKSKDTGFPNGIYAQLSGTITASNQWQTVEFTYLDTPDWSVADGDVDRIAVLFNPNTNDDKLWYFDNVGLDYFPLDESISGPAPVNNPGPTDQYNYTAPVYTGSTYAWAGSSGATVVSGDGTNSVMVSFTPPVSNYNADLDLTITDSEGCTRDLSTSITVEAPVGFESFESGEIVISPNPSISSFHFTASENLEIISVSVASMDGKEILSLDEPGNEFSIGEELNCGVYVMFVETNLGTKSIRISKN